MKLRCNLGAKLKENCASFKTDVLWLRTINKRDYLVCKDHRGGFDNAKSEGIISRVQKDRNRAS